MKLYVDWKNAQIVTEVGKSELLEDIEENIFEDNNLMRTIVNDKYDAYDIYELLVGNNDYDSIVEDIKEQISEEVSALAEVEFDNDFEFYDTNSN